jgi:hypothetical protein
MIHKLQPKRHSPVAIEGRRSIPAAVARELRQEAGFGCCKCGLPILQYHHIIPWSEEEHFRPEDMMVLCPLHHDQATKGAMPEGEQRELKARPLNIVKGRAKGLIEIKQDYCAAEFGSITVVGEGSFIKINGEDILSLDMGVNNLELSLRLYAQDDALLVCIERNEWVSGDPNPWDIEADWQTLTLREKTRKISISVDAKKIPLQLRGEFWRFGKRVSIGKDAVMIHGSSVIGLQHLALVGGGVDLNVDRVTIASGGSIVSRHPPRERLWKARDEWRKIKAQRMAGTEPRGPAGT